jgi:hypothetical protein
VFATSWNVETGMNDIINCYRETAHIRAFVKMLVNEPPRTVAAVVANLGAVDAGDTLCRLPAALVGPVILCLSGMADEWRTSWRRLAGSLPAEAVVFIEERETGQDWRTPLERIAAVLETCEEGIRWRLLTTVAEIDRDTAARIHDHLTVKADNPQYVLGPWPVDMEAERLAAEWASLAKRIDYASNNENVDLDILFGPKQICEDENGIPFSQEELLACGYSDTEIERLHQERNAKWALLNKQWVALAAEMRFPPPSDFFD